MTDLKPFWERIAVAMPRVLEGWSIRFESGYGILFPVYSFEEDYVTQHREAAMRVMDELEARGLAWFDRDCMGSGFYTVSSMDDDIEPIALAKGNDLAAPYVECLMMTLEALANE